MADRARDSLGPLGGVEDDVFLDLGQELGAVPLEPVVLLQLLRLGCRECGDLGADSLVHHASLDVDDVRLVGDTGANAALLTLHLSHRSVCHRLDNVTDGTSHSLHATLGVGFDSLGNLHYQLGGANGATEVRGKLLGLGGR